MRAVAPDTSTLHDTRCQHSTAAHYSGAKHGLLLPSVI
jgi:hypothetical protein